MRRANGRKKKKRKIARPTLTAVTRSGASAAEKLGEKERIGRRTAGAGSLGGPCGVRPARKCACVAYDLAERVRTEATDVRARIVSTDDWRLAGRLRCTARIPRGAWPRAWTDRGEFDDQIRFCFQTVVVLFFFFFPFSILFSRSLTAANG